MHLQRKFIPALSLLLIIYTIPSFGNGTWNESSEELVAPSEAFLNENNVSTDEESFNNNFAGVLRAGNEAVNPDNEGDDFVRNPLPIRSGRGILAMAVLSYLLLQYLTGRKQKRIYHTHLLPH